MRTAKGLKCEAKVHYDRWAKQWVKCGKPARLVKMGSWIDPSIEPAPIALCEEHIKEFSQLIRKAKEIQGL